MSDNRQSLSDLGAIAAGEQAVATNAQASSDARADAYLAGQLDVPSTPAPLRQQEIDKLGRAYATGRRKDAVARVWIKPGSGKITINGRRRSHRCL